MRKVIISAFIVFLLIGNIAIADQRWEKVYGSGNMTVSIDSETYSVYTGTDGDTYIDCWIKAIDTKKPGFLVMHTYFNLKNLRNMTKEVIAYDDNGKFVDQADESSKGWSVPIPESNGENLYKAIVVWIAENIDIKPPKRD